MEVSVAVTLGVKLEVVQAVGERELLEEPLPPGGPAAPREVGVTPEEMLELREGVKAKEGEWVAVGEEVREGEREVEGVADPPPPRRGLWEASCAVGEGVMEGEWEVLGE